MLRTIRNRMKREKEPRILILGLDNAGKTTILKKLGDEEQGGAPEGPTQGFNIKNLSLEGRSAKLCDLGGQRALRDFWQDYYENTDCLMYVVDSSDQRRLEEAHATFVDVINSVPRVPVLVFANKQDLATAKDPAMIAEILELVECRDRKWQIQGCSAKTGDGLEIGVQWIMQNCP
jgi:ADP-ribosylation factor-like protein 3